MQNKGSLGSLRHTHTHTHIHARTHACMHSHTPPHTHARMHTHLLQNHALDLKKVCLDFVSRNLAAVMATDGYK